MTAQQTIERLLAKADIAINGNRPWDLQIHDRRIFSRVLAQGSLGLGESYMDGWWDADALDEFFTRLLGAHLDAEAKKSLGLLLHALKSRVFNLQSRTRAFEVGEKHYDIGNELYGHMLGETMMYTCGYWSSANNLDDAQRAKLHLVCKKIGLKAGDRVLDIGCGWGTFAKFAVEEYGASVVGVTVSKEQLELARSRCAGLPVEFRLQDYRELNEPFDHIVSLGMFEHVGVKNYRTYFEVAARCLKKDGLFLLHTIGGTQSVAGTDPWIEKYIFANSMLPSVAQIGAAIEGLFVMEDWHNFGADYDKTLMSWYHNVESHWDEIAPRYSERFHRMWRYYLLSCAGSFRSRRNQLWQIVLSPKGVTGGYISHR